MGDRVLFSMFAALILFSMIREWSAPTGCARTAIMPALFSKANTGSEASGSRPSP
jgi:hypothetical protein